MKYLIVIAVSLCPQLSRAESIPAQPIAPSPKAQAEKWVQDKLLAPLARKDSETEIMSRRMPPPRHREVRILDRQPLIDEHSQRFLRFAVDERFGSARTEWTADAIVGCVYLDSEKVYVKKGHEYRSAEFMLGKYSKAVGGTTCQSATVGTTTLQARR